MKFFLIAIAVFTLSNANAQSLFPYRDANTNLIGFRDIHANIVVAPQYEYIRGTGDGLIPVQLNQLWGYIDATTGKEKIPFVYSSVGRFAAGIAPAMLNHKWGYINMKGETVIKFSYDYIGEFHPDGKALAKKNGKFGYIDKKEKVLIDFQFDDVEIFINGKALVSANGKQFYIDTTGAFVGDYIVPEEEPVAVEEEMIPPTEVIEEKQMLYTFVEEWPVFPGGEGELMLYLSKNIVYPKDAMDAGIQGKVFLQFTVQADGSITDVSIVRGIPLLDAEALRVVKAMPKWIPGKQGGKAVSVRFNLPVSFKLK